MIERIRTEIPDSASSKVLDCPVWLNAIIDQLLAKDPRQRPFSATALLWHSRKLSVVMWKVVGVLQHATAGFSPLQLAADRSEAEKVLGIKHKKERSERESTPFFERPLILFTALVLAVAWLCLVPPSAR